MLFFLFRTLSVMEGSSERTGLGCLHLLLKTLGWAALNFGTLESLPQVRAAGNSLCKLQLCTFLSLTEILGPRFSLEQSWGISDAGKWKYLESKNDSSNLLQVQ